MVIDTNTGEVLKHRGQGYFYNEPLISYHSNSAIFGGRLRRSAPTLLIICAVLLIYSNLLSRLNGSNTTPYTFTGLLKYLSEVGQYDYPLLTNQLNDVASFRSIINQIIAYNIPDDSIFHFLNGLWNIIKPIFTVIGTTFNLVSYMYESLQYALIFIIDILGYFFGGYI